MSQLNASNTDSQGLTYSLYDGNDTGIAWDIGEFIYWLGISFHIYHFYTNGILDVGTNAAGPAYIKADIGNSAPMWNHWEVDRWGRIIVRYYGYICLYDEYRLVDYRTLDKNDMKQYWILKGSKIINRSNNKYLYATVAGDRGPTTSTHLQSNDNIYSHWYIRQSNEGGYNYYINLASDTAPPSNVRRQAILRNMTRKVYDHKYDIGILAYLNGAVIRFKSRENTTMYLNHANSKNGSGGLLIWSYLDYDETFIVNANGVLVPYERQSWCIDVDNCGGFNDMNYVKMKPTSTATSNNVWGYDGDHIFLARDPTVFMDDANVNTNGGFIYLRRYDANDKRRQWDIVIESNVNTIPIKRGVKDTNGNIYKITAAQYSVNKYKFERHKANEIEGIYKNNTWTYKT